MSTIKRFNKRLIVYVCTFYHFKTRKVQVGDMKLCTVALGFVKYRNQVDDMKKKGKCQRNRTYLYSP